MKKVSEQIRKRILEDNQFSLEMASMLNILQVSVKHLARRNSDKLTQYQLVEFYKQKGYTENQIFEQK